MKSSMAAQTLSGSEAPPSLPDSRPHATTSCRMQPQAPKISSFDLSFLHTESAGSHNVAANDVEWPRLGLGAYHSAETYVQV